MDGNTSLNPLLDMGHDADGQLRIAWSIQVVVVIVEHRVRVGGVRGLEGDAHEVLAQHIVEDRRSERAIVFEDLVDDVLFV